MSQLSFRPESFAAWRGFIPRAATADRRSPPAAEPLFIQSAAAFRFPQRQIPMTHVRCVSRCRAWWVVPRLIRARHFGLLFAGNGHKASNSGDVLAAMPGIGKRNAHESLGFAALRKAKCSRRSDEERLSRWR